MPWIKPKQVQPHDRQQAAAAAGRGDRRRTLAAKAGLFGLLAGARSALAGWFVLLPLLLFGLVVTGILAVATAIVASQSDPYGPSGDSGGTSQQPEHPDGGRSGGGSQPEAPRRGSLEMRLDGPVDFRELRYTLQYRAGEPPMPGESLHLYAVRDADDRVRAVPPEQILGQAGRYPQLLEPGVRLCQRGLTLNSTTPQCQGVLRISPAYTDVQSVRTQVSAQASLRPPAGPASEPDEADEVSASAGLRLLNTFFAVLTGPPDFRSRVSVIEQDPEHPEVFRFHPAPASGTDEPSEGAARRLELARDRSRVYLLTDRRLSDWTGDGRGFRVLYRPEHGERLAGATPTATGVCVAWSRDDQSGLRCLRQDHDNWGPEQLFPRPMDVVDMDSAAGSMLIVGSEPGHADQARGYYVADTAQPWLQLEDAPVGRAGVLHVDGVVALKAWPGGREDYLIRGVFGGQRPGLWQLGLGGAGADQAPAFFLPEPQPDFNPFPGMAHPVRDVDVWPDLAPGMARVLALAQRPAVIDYSLLHRQPVAASRKEWQAVLGASRLDTVRVLDGAGRQKWLALSGRGFQQPRNFIALMRYRSPASEPELIRVLDFSDPAQSGSPIRFEPQVREISQNALVLAADV